MEVIPYDSKVDLFQKVIDHKCHMVRYFRKWTKVFLPGNVVFFDKQDQEGQFSTIDTSQFVPWWIDPRQLPPEDGKPNYSFLYE